MTSLLAHMYILTGLVSMYRSSDDDVMVRSPPVTLVVVCLRLCLFLASVTLVASVFLCICIVSLFTFDTLFASVCIYACLLYPQSFCMPLSPCGLLSLFSHLRLFLDLDVFWYSDSISTCFFLLLFIVSPL